MQFFLTNRVLPVRIRTIQGVVGETNEISFEIK